MRALRRVQCELCVRWVLIRPPWRAKWNLHVLTVRGSATARNVVGSDTQLAAEAEPKDEIYRGAGNMGLEVLDVRA